MSTKHKIIKATVVIFLFSSFGKALGFLREMLIAARFGTTANTDAYFVGLAGPEFVRDIISGGVLTAVFIPAYAQALKHRSRADADRLFSNISLLMMLMLAGAIVLGMIFPGALVRVVAPEIGGETFFAASRVTRILFPSIFFMGVASFYGALLNVHERFVATASTQTLLNIGIIVGVILLSTRWGVNSIAAGFLLGAVLQWLVILPSMRALSVRRDFVWGVLPETRKLLRSMVPLFIAALFGMLNDLLSRSMAAGLDAGSVSALSFSNRLRETPWLLCGVPLATAVFPFLSHNAGPDDRKHFIEIFEFSLRLTAFLAIPVCVFMFLFNVPIIQILFERGMFDASSTAVTARALRYASIGAAFYAINYIIMRAYYSTGKVNFLIISAFAGVIVNFGLGLYLRQHWAVGGITLARSASEVVMFLCLLMYLKTVITEVRLSQQLTYIAGISASAVAACLGALMTYALLPAQPGIASSIFRLGIAAAIVTILYGGFGFIFRNTEMHSFIRLLKSRLAHRNATV